MAVDPQIMQDAMIPTHFRYILGLECHGIVPWNCIRSRVLNQWRNLPWGYFRVSDGKLVAQINSTQTVGIFYAYYFECTF